MQIKGRFVASGSDLLGMNTQTLNNSDIADCVKLRSYQFEIVFTK